MVSWYEIFEPPVKSWEANRDLAKLLAGISHEDDEIRCLSFDALGRIGATTTTIDANSVILDISKAIKTEVSTEVRARAAIALGRLGGGEAVITLCDLLNDEYGDVRAAAVKALSQNPEPEMLSIFCAMLEDEYESVVIEAIHSLGRLGSYRAVTSLHRLFDRCERPIRELASTAIHSINLNSPMERMDNEVYFFTYSRRRRFYCECYSYKLLAWRNYVRRRWRYPFALDWGIGYWELSTIAQHISAKLLRPGLKLEVLDLRS